MAAKPGAGTEPASMPPACPRSSPRSPAVDGGGRQGPAAPAAPEALMSISSFYSSREQWFSKYGPGTRVPETSAGSGRFEMTLVTTLSSVLLLQRTQRRSQPVWPVVSHVDTPRPQVIRPPGSVLQKVKRHRFPLCFGKRLGFIWNGPRFTYDRWLVYFM